MRCPFIQYFHVYCIVLFSTLLIALRQVLSLLPIPLFVCFISLQSRTVCFIFVFLPALPGVLYIFACPYFLFPYARTRLGPRVCRPMPRQALIYVATGHLIRELYLSPPGAFTKRANLPFGKMRCHLLPQLLRRSTAR